MTIPARASSSCVTGLAGPARSAIHGALAWQPALDVDCGIGIGVRPRRVVDAERGSPLGRARSRGTARADPRMAFAARNRSCGSRQAAPSSPWARHVFGLKRLVHRHAPLARGRCRRNGDGKFPSLRRHDPDQVRRVSAGPQARQRTLSPFPGAPLGTGQCRPRAACQIESRRLAALRRGRLVGDGRVRSPPGLRLAPQILVAHDAEDRAETKVMAAPE